MGSYSVVTPVGEFIIGEMFFYYDRPRIFSCVNKVGALFLGFLAEEDAKVDRWFFVPISNRRLGLLKNRKTSVRLAITEAEEGWLWQITLSLTNERDGTWEIIRTGELSDDDLPDDDSYIDVQSFEHAYDGTSSSEGSIPAQETTEEMEVLGTLAGINTTRNTFSLKEAAGQYFYGSLSDNFKEYVFQVPGKVKALVESTIEINPHTKREVTIFRLLKVEPVYGPSGTCD